MSYAGRFAPSPTGPLHFGSLVAATASFLDARAAGGKWLVRMEDLDTPRVQPGADRDILLTLERFGFEWDGSVLYQSTRTGAYRAAFNQLQTAGQVYGCGCTRTETGEQNRYKGSCRSGLEPGRTPRAWRARVTQDIVQFHDRLQGLYSQNVETHCGDFVVLRADGLFAYQLAVVVDDFDQGITDVVRGADLLDSTPRQIHLQRLLDLRTPRYLHTPVAVNSAGQKLSKQAGAPPIRDCHAGTVLTDVLYFLGQDPLPEFRRASPPGIWKWAIGRWTPDRAPRKRTAPAPLRLA